RAGGGCPREPCPPASFLPLLVWLCPAPPVRDVLLEVRRDVQFLVEGAVPAGLHLLDGALVGPVLELHAVDRARRPGAVDAVETVDQDGVVARVGQDLLEHPHALVGRRVTLPGVPAPRRDADVADALGAAVLLLAEVRRGLPRRPLVPQRDDRAD